jgi:hypothetical protein
MSIINIAGLLIALYVMAVVFTLAENSILRLWKQVLDKLKTK